MQPTPEERLGAVAPIPHQGAGRGSDMPADIVSAMMMRRLVQARPTPDLTISIAWAVRYAWATMTRSHNPLVACRSRQADGSDAQARYLASPDLRTWLHQRTLVAC